ncbi:SH3 domain-containing protein [Porphyromonadaceae bacterium OttesenSCG-928-L07]|nr:SH3 domain-containing protein [Porphyromonadaceae bacterium OttesenSCG-928-L07]
MKTIFLIIILTTCFLSSFAQTNSETYYVNSSSKLNVREFNDKNAKIIGSLSPKEEVEVTKIVGDWAEIKFVKKRAYVHSGYVSKVQKKNINTPYIYCSTFLGIWIKYWGYFTLFLASIIGIIGYKIEKYGLSNLAMITLCIATLFMIYGYYKEYFLIGQLGFFKILICIIFFGFIGIAFYNMYRAFFEWLYEISSRNCKINLSIYPLYAVIITLILGLYIDYSFRENYNDFVNNLLYRRGFWGFAFSLSVLTAMLCFIIHLIIIIKNLYSEGIAILLTGLLVYIISYLTIIISAPVYGLSIIGCSLIRSFGEHQKRNPTTYEARTCFNCNFEKMNYQCPRARLRNVHGTPCSHHRYNFGSESSW